MISDWAKDAKESLDIEIKYRFQNLSKNLSLIINDIKKGYININEGKALEEIRSSFKIFNRLTENKN